MFLLHRRLFSATPFPEQVVLLSSKGTKHLVHLKDLTTGSSATERTSSRRRRRAGGGSSVVSALRPSLIREAGMGGVVSPEGSKERFLVLPVTVKELALSARAESQVVYPKDAAYLLYRMSVRSGDTVLEAGCGSGSFSLSLAHALFPEGVVHSFENRPEAFERCRKTFGRFPELARCINLQLRDVEEEGFHVEGGPDLTACADAAFLDLRNPSALLAEVHRCMKPGAVLACLLPTTNQVSEVVAALEKHPFVDVQVEELFLRSYKPVPERLRPADQMVAHTAYLVFCRAARREVDTEQFMEQSRWRFLQVQRAMEQRSRTQQQENESEEGQGHQ